MLALESLDFDELDLRFEMDLGRRFLIDEADMDPKNRVSMFSVLSSGLMVH